MVAGYSGTPLAAKLGLKSGTRLLVVNAPAGYCELLAPLPDGARISTRTTARADIVHHFATRQLPTDIAQGTIRDVALPLGYVDIKVCAVSGVWSGLKLVVRKELR